LKKKDRTRVFEKYRRDSRLERVCLLFAKYHNATEIEKLKDRTQTFAEMKKDFISIILMEDLKWMRRRLLSLT
jgi:CRISPR/Cas system-associated endoribonuclease Cas2